MDIINKILSIMLTLVISLCVFFMGTKVKAESSPNKLYQVYLNGEKLGLLQDKSELLNLIDKEQSAIKEKYNIDKVYPPNGLDIQEVLTYNNEVSSAEAIYEKIKSTDPFTISGYKVTINYEESEDGSKKEPLVLNVLRKEDFEEGFYNTVAAFVGSEDLIKYENNTQSEIIDVGSKIENVYWKENITIKEDYLSVDDFIYENSSDISKYLLFGTLEEKEKYSVKEGDSIESVANAYNLNVDELLVANPTFTSANVLLAKGQELNTALINPQVSIVYEVEKVEDIEESFKTEYQDDSSMYVGNNETIQEGQDGVIRVTEKIQYINGEIQGLYITNDTTVITPTINKIVKRGTKKNNTTAYEWHEYNFSDGEWQWPTITPYVITSKYEYRWGSLHQGLDISGCGYGSPIYAAKDGVVTETGSHSSMGIYVIVNHGDNYYTIYMHLSKYIVSVGQSLSKGQQLGMMGKSGNATGTHLHFGVYIGYPYKGGYSVNPCKSVFSC